MKNEANIILGLINKTYAMNYFRINDESLAEYSISFSCYNYELLEGYVTIQLVSTTYKNTKIKKRLKLPLDFDEINGMDALLRLIAAFACPTEDIVFSIHRKKEHICIARYKATRLPTGSRTIEKIFEVESPLLT